MSEFKTTLEAKQYVWGCIADALEKEIDGACTVADLLGYPADPERPDVDIVREAGESVLANLRALSGCAANPSTGKLATALMRTLSDADDVFAMGRMATKTVLPNGYTVRVVVEAPRQRKAKGATRRGKPFDPDWASPPGHTIRDMMYLHGVLESTLSGKLGVAESELEGILSGKTEITSDIACKLAGAFPVDVPAEFWMEREKQYRDSLAKIARRNGKASASKSSSTKSAQERFLCNEQNAGVVAALAKR
jgi:plasmid maintenance system antidote protein VapI